MIGELDAFLEDVEADEMEASERAEFIKYLISRGMFDKAYYWLRSFGVADVESKSVARLVSKRIVSKDYEYDEFLVNVAYYIYKNMKYDENILRYLMMNYEGRASDLRKLWRSADDLELDAKRILERLLRQLVFTGAAIQDRDEMVIAYVQYEDHDVSLVNGILMNIAYEYFVYESIINPEVFDILYQKYVKKVLTDRVCKLALLKFWAENVQQTAIPQDVARLFIRELLNEDIYFPFYVKLVELVPELHYIKNSIFIEYRTQPQSQVYMHYTYDDDSVEESSYEIREMKEMYDGIHVSMFQLFYGETIQYYITENYLEDDGVVREHVTQSGTLSGLSETSAEAGKQGTDDRFSILNDILLSISVQDEVTAQQLTEDYVYQDFCVRELFKVL